MLQLDFLSIFLYSIYPKYVNKERGGSDFKCITFYLLLVQHENSKYMSFWQELHRVNKTVNLFWLLYGQMKNNFNYVYQEVLEKNYITFLSPFHATSCLISLSKSLLVQKPKYGTRWRDLSCLRFHNAYYEWLIKTR